MLMSKGSLAIFFFQQRIGGDTGRRGDRAAIVAARSASHARAYDKAGIGLS